MIEASRIGTHGNAHLSDPWQVWLVRLKLDCIADCTSANHPAVAMFMLSRHASPASTVAQTAAFTDTLPLLVTVTVAVNFRKQAGGRLQICGGASSNTFKRSHPSNEACMGQAALGRGLQHA